MARIEGQNEISFEDLFNNSVENTLIDYKCSNCDFVKKKMKQSANYSFVNNPFLIIRITNSIIKKNGQSIYLKTKISNFDSKKIVIPNDPTKTIFKVNAAICFQPSDKVNPSMGGHYTCWVRGKIENKWFQLSDTVVSEHMNFPRNLNNVSILFLNK